MPCLYIAQTLPVFLLPAGMFQRVLLRQMSLESSKSTGFFEQSGNFIFLAFFPCIWDFT